jgi:SNF2 family DNA or RNA helicase
MLIQTNAGGEGINLHKATKVVDFDQSFNPTTDQQAHVGNQLN